MDCKITDLMNLDKTIAKPLMEKYTYPWEVLPHIKDFILELGATLEGYDQLGENIWVHPTAKIAESALLTGPLIVCENAEIRHCAFIRGNAIVGAGATVGNSVELKNCILFNESQVPHFNYCGDSVLGYKSHIGAGGITSNLKSDKTNVVVKDFASGEKLETGLRKFGAMLGDNVEVGCNSVLNPGTVIGANSMVYPTSCVRGFLPANSIFKDKDNVVQKR